MLVYTCNPISSFLRNLYSDLVDSSGKTQEQRAPYQRNFIKPENHKASEQLVKLAKKKFQLYVQYDTTYFAARFLCILLTWKTPELKRNFSHKNNYSEK